MAPRLLIVRNTPGDATFKPFYTKTRPCSVNALQWQSTSVVACLSTVEGSASSRLSDFMLYEPVVCGRPSDDAAIAEIDTFFATRQ